MDYVVAHEVAHLRHMDHGPAFWALTRKLSRNYEAGYEWMQAHGHELMRNWAARRLRLPRSTNYSSIFAITLAKLQRALQDMLGRQLIHHLCPFRSRHIHSVNQKTIHGNCG